MRSIWFSATLSILLLALVVVSVSAQGYPPEIVIIEPPVLTVVNNQITGTLAFVYPGGGPVCLDRPWMTIIACGKTGCIKVEVPIKPDGTFTIPFTANFPTGTVALYIVAGSMRDCYGITFPNVDTRIGVITVPSASPPGGGAPSSSAYNSKPPSLFRVAGQTVQQSQVSYAILGLLGLLVVAGAVIVLAPKTKRET